MKLATFDTDDGRHLGVVEGDELADITAVDGRLGPDLGAVLAAGLLDQVAGLVAAAPRRPLAGATLTSPVLRPPKFLAIGLNYAKHVAESGMDKPAAKQPDAKPAMNFIRADAVFCADDHPDSGEPFIKADWRIFHDGSNLDGELPMVMFLLAFPNSAC